MNGNKDNEPTAKKPAAVSVGLLEDLETEAYEVFHVYSRPPGDEWLLMVLYISRRIIEEGLAGKITDEDLAQLTEENFHTAAHAARIIQTLNKYNR